MVSIFAEELLEEGMAKGVAQGMAQGMAQGRTDGKIDAILRILTHRFGALDPAVVARIRQAEAARLDDLLDQALRVDRPADLSQDSDQNRPR